MTEQRCPWCNDERLDAVIDDVVSLLEEWCNQGKAQLTAHDWTRLAHAIAYDTETRS